MKYFLSCVQYLFVSCTILSCTNSDNTTDEKVEKPNIIYILADDLGYGDLGCYGQQIIKTPAIDRMASEGMRFTNHYAGNAVCAPSRNNLLTGLHPGHASIRGNGCKGGCSMPDSDITVAEYLKEVGYVTGLIGKWSNGQHGTEGFPTKQGFDFFYGYDNQILAHNYWPEYLWRNNEKEYLDNQVKYLDSTSWHIGLGSYTLEKEEYAHDLFVKETKEFINDHQDTSFFLYLPFTIPHNNGEAPNGKKQEVPDYGIYTEKNWATDTMGYAAMITRMDRDIGQLLDLLQQLEIAENTLVIFDSDNGSMQEWSGITEFFDSNGPFKGGKRELYEGGIRVPMIAWWPGTVKAGTVTEHITATWDFLPTACEMAEVETPSKTDGISFLPLLKGEEQPSHEFLYWEYESYGGQQAVRMGQWKGIRHHLADNPEAPLELYNLEDDPGEIENLAFEHPKIVEKIKTIMQEQHIMNKQFLLPIDTLKIK
jgi:arylsulfatase A-like enzyme